MVANNYFAALGVCHFAQGQVGGETHEIILWIDRRKIGNSFLEFFAKYLIVFSRVQLP